MTARLFLASAFLLAAGAASAKECRLPADWPPGVRPPAGAACAAKRPAARSAADEVRAGREPGFVDLGNGSSLRVSGRVRVDVTTRR